MQPCVGPVNTLGYSVRLIVHGVAMSSLRRSGHESSDLTRPSSALQLHSSSAPLTRIVTSDEVVLHARLRGLLVLADVVELRQLLALSGTPHPEPRAMHPYLLPGVRQPQAHHWY